MRGGGGGGGGGGSGQTIGKHTLCIGGRPLPWIGAWDTSAAAALHTHLELVHRSRHHCTLLSLDYCLDTNTPMHCCPWMTIIVNG